MNKKVNRIKNRKRVTEASGPNSKAVVRELLDFMNANGLVKIVTDRKTLETIIENPQSVSLDKGGKVLVARKATGYVTHGKKNEKTMESSRRRKGVPTKVTDFVSKVNESADDDWVEVYLDDVDEDRLKAIQQLNEFCEEAMQGAYSMTPTRMSPGYNERLEISVHRLNISAYGINKIDTNAIDELLDEKGYIPLYESDDPLSYVVGAKASANAYKKYWNKVKSKYPLWDIDVEIDEYEGNSYVILKATLAR